MTRPEFELKEVEKPQSLRVRDSALPAQGQGAGSLVSLAFDGNNRITTPGYK
ncbi:MAG TPA: hypothetical protein VG028_15080 [Terriglobia bacterium]|nr:hypothetical protein [Terriglobia bacterium]